MQETDLEVFDMRYINEVNMRATMASRACAAPSATGTKSATRSTSTPTQRLGSKEGLAHLMLPTLDRGDTVLRTPVLREK